MHTNNNVLGIIQRKCVSVFLISMVKKKTAIYLHQEQQFRKRVQSKNEESNQKAKRAHCSKTEINQEAI